MPEKPKEKKENAEEKLENDEKEDFQKRSYYYDDAHGYEIYDPDEEDEEGNEPRINTN